MKGFMEGFLFRPQGEPMIYPYGLAAKFSQFPYRYVWKECWHFRYIAYSMAFVVFPIYWQIDKKLTGPENSAYWREKRKHDLEHHHAELKKKWEVRT
jgi:hypothetical protein